MKYFLLICSFFLTSIVSAQDKSETLSPVKPGFILSTPLTSLTETEGGPSIGLEYRILEGLAVGVEGMAVLYTTFPFAHPHEYAKSGFRIKPEIKYFPVATRGKSVELYFSLQAVYKQIRFSEFSSVAPVTSRKKRIVIAWSPNVGLQRYLDRSHHLMIDMYLGLGIRHRKTDPDYNEWVNDGLFEGGRLITIDEDGYNPHLAFGFKLGYRF